MTTNLSRRLPALLLLLTCGLPAAAQYRIGLSGQLPIPMQEFAQVNPRIAYGIGGYALLRIGADAPLYVGIDINYSLYGSSTTDLGRVDFTTRAERVINNNILMGHLMLRLQIGEEGSVQGYLDVLGGGKYLYTRSKINVIDINTGNVVNTTNTRTEFWDMAWSYGGAAGINIRLGENILLDVRCLYLAGTTANYVRQVTRTGNGYVYDEGQSRTDMLVPQVGIVFKIDK
jgi:hypothetical protein